LEIESDNLIIEGSGSNIITDTNVVDSIFTINANGVQIHGLHADISNILNKRFLKLGHYTTPADFSIFDTLVISDCHITANIEAAACIDMYGRFLNVSIKNNTLVNTSATRSATQKCIEAHIGNSIANNDIEFNLTIEGNYIKNFWLGFDNYSTGYLRNLVVRGNTFKECGNSIRNYHCYGSIIEANRFLDSYTYTNFWRGVQIKNNYWFNSGPDVANPADIPCCVLVEAIDGDFAGNIIENPKGHGLLLDGGNGPGRVFDNTIINAEWCGIYVSPNFRYGGQIVAQSVYDNRVRGCGQHGIYLHNGTFRNYKIYDNLITGIGNLAPDLYAGIMIEPGIEVGSTGRFEDCSIYRNEIYGNDSTYGIQDSQIAWGIYLKDALAGANSAADILDNIIEAPTCIKVDRSGNAMNISNFYRTTSVVFDIPTGASIYYGKQHRLDSSLTWMGKVQPYTSLDFSINSAAARLGIISSSGAVSQVHYTSPGIHLIAGGASSGYQAFPALKWLSTDAELTSNNPRLGAFITAIASQVYSADNHGGMDIEFCTRPNSVSPSVLPMRAVMITNDGKLRLYSRLDTTKYVGISTNSPTSSYNIILPDTAPTVASVMQAINVNGTTKWTNLAILNNGLTASETTATLNAAYPNELIGFTVYSETNSIAYTKLSSVWEKRTILTV
jgi:hypothetical protein